MMIVDWLNDLRARRSDPRSTKELREKLYSIVCDETDDDISIALHESGPGQRGNHRSVMQKFFLRRSICKDKIATLGRDDLLAVIEASKHPHYSVSKSLRESLVIASDLRSIALFFDTLHDSRMDRILYTIALHALALIDGKETVFRLHRTAPEAAKSFLILICYFLTEGVGVGKIHPGIKSMVMDDPDVVDALLDFMRQRKIKCFNDLDPVIFREVTEGAYMPLREGVL